MKRIVLFISTILVLLSCSETPKESNEINLYSQRHYKVDENQYEAFENETAITFSFLI